MLLSPLLVSGQIGVLADQYTMNIFQMNPATAGISNIDPLVVNSMVSGLSWSEGFPNTQNVTFHAKLFREKRAVYNQRGFLNRGKNTFGKVGLGTGLFNYKYGQISETGFHIDYAYHFFLGDGRLCLGLAPVFIRYSSNFSKNQLVFENPDDPAGEKFKDPVNLNIIDFNAGIHYYSNSLSAGVSLIQLSNSAIFWGVPFYSIPKDNKDLKRSLFAYLGYVFEISRNLWIEPYAMISNSTITKELRPDLSVNLYIGKEFQTGITYKWDKSVAWQIGVNYSNLSFKYYYEFPFSDNFKKFGNFSTHMVQIGFDPGFKIL